MDFYEQLSKSWEVVTQAPLPAIALVVLGYSVHAWYVNERIDGLVQQNGNYRRALEIDEKGKGALANLSNDDLKDKAKHTVALLRDLQVTLGRGMDQQLKPMREKLAK